MSNVAVRSYSSPRLVPLALDWAAGATRNFLGFAIRRTPPFRGERSPISAEARSGVGYQTASALAAQLQRGDIPSNEAPIQKFMWWDARIDEDQTGSSFEYVN